MKKLFLLTFLVFLSSALFADNAASLKSDGKSDKKISLDSIDKNLEGKAKLGLSLGYPTGITFGFQMTKLVELNATAGLFDLKTVSLGINTLFSILDIEGSSTVFPVSAGPAIYLHTGNNSKVDILGILRIEYDFDDMPLNLFLEGGAGMRIRPDTELVGSGSIGVRYIF